MLKIDFTWWDPQQQFGQHRTWSCCVCKWQRRNLVSRVFRLPTRGSGRRKTTPSCGKTKDPGNEVDSVVRVSNSCKLYPFISRYGRDEALFSGQMQYGLKIPRYNAPIQELQESRQKVFIPFVKPWHDPDRCKKWVNACSGKNFTTESITKNSYICALHWPKQRGSTEEFPDPLKATLTTEENYGENVS